MAYVPLPRVFPVLYCEREEDGERLELRSEKVGGGLYTWQGTVCEGGMMFVSACGRDWIEIKQERARVSAEDPEMSHLVVCASGRPAFRFRVVPRGMGSRVFSLR